MKKLSIILLSVLFVFFMASCGGDKTNENGTNDSTQTNESITDEDVDPSKKFGVEKGSMEFKMGTMGMQSNMEMYWRNDGKETATITTMNMMGIQTTSYTIIKSDYVYTWDDMTKMGTKVKIDMDLNNQAINYNNLDKDFMDEYNMKEEGTEEIMGKTCKVFTMNHQGVNSKTWVWKGIGLKSETTVAGIKTSLEVTKIEEGVEPPAEVFEIPEDIKFQDVNVQMDDANAQMDEINKQMQNGGN